MSLGFLPVAVYELLGRRRWLGLRARQLTAGLAIVVLLVLLIPHFFGRSYLDYAYQTFGARRLSFQVHYNGRTFYYGRPDVAKSAQDLLDVIPKYARPGDKLFVGRTDLRKTPYSDAYLYYLLPEYAPGTYYIEMDPGVANADDSRMPKDLKRSQLVILSGVWNDWSEPNDSRKLGSPKSNRVLHRLFCRQDWFGQRPDDGVPLYELWIRKSRGPCDGPPLPDAKPKTSSDTSG